MADRQINQPYTCGVRHAVCRDLPFGSLTARAYATIEVGSVHNGRGLKCLRDNPQRAC
jgi:hypothetical protein